jgi:hypothetical protein
MNCENRRLHIVLSLDNPMQRETWLILSQAKNKTSAVCEAVCGYQKQKVLEDTLRTVIREELKHIPTPQPAENASESESVVDAAVVDFLLALQEE